MLILPKGVSVTVKQSSHIINFIVKKTKQLKYLKANSNNLVNFLKKFLLNLFSNDFLNVYIDRPLLEQTG